MRRLPCRETPTTEYPREMGYCTANFLAFSSISVVHHPSGQYATPKMGPAPPGKCRLSYRGTTLPISISVKGAKVFGSGPGMTAMLYPPSLHVVDAALLQCRYPPRNSDNGTMYLACPNRKEPLGVVYPLARDHRVPFDHS